MIVQRQRERQKEYRRERDQQSQYKTIDSITDMLHQSGEIPNSISRRSDEDVEPKIKKCYKDVNEADTVDQLPNELRYICYSQRKVRHDFYKTVANLTGCLRGNGNTLM